MILILPKAKTAMRRLWSRWTGSHIGAGLLSAEILPKSHLTMKIKGRRDRHRLDCRSGRRLEIPWQIAPDNSVTLTLLTAER